MSRRARCVTGALSLVVVLSATAGGALAGKPAPKEGRFATTAKVSGGYERGYFTVSRTGVSDFELALPLVCETGVGAFHTGIEIGPANLSASGKAAPLKIAGGKFDYDGPVYEGLSVTGKIRIAGTFKSPTKLVVKVKASWPTSVLSPGVEGACETGNLTYSGPRE